MAEENTGDFNEEKEAAEAEAAAKLEAEEKEENDKKGDGGKEDDKKEEGKEKEEEKEEKYDEKEEPPTRKSVQDHIIERKDKKIAKLEEKEEEKKEKEEEGNFTPEDKDAIGKEVKKETEPLKEVLKAQSDKNELDALKNKIKDEGLPKMSKTLEKRITKYANHKSYQNVPYENIYLMLAGQKSISQAKKTEAKKGDKENETGGHTKRAKKGGEPDYANMSDKEFDKVDQDLMTGQL